jgi:hypothetical protein
MYENIDPKSDRVVKSLPAPPQRPLTSVDLFLSSNKIDWKLLRDHIKREGKVGEIEMMQMLDVAGWIISTI